MKIDRAEARRIAELAHLDFDDRALDRMAADMTRILEYVERLRERDSGIAVPDSQTTAMRGDAAAPSLDRQSVAENAPQWRDGFFVVPPVISDER